MTFRLSRFFHFSNARRLHGLALPALTALTALTILLSACGGGDEADTPEHRAALVAATDQQLHALQTKHPMLPGIAVHVRVEPARLAWSGSTGVADRETGRPLQPNATFRTASVTKTFTAATIYRLGEMARLDTTDSIERHLSPATLATLREGGYDTAAITIDDLLTHRSGLPDHALSEPYLLAVLANPAHRWSRAEQLAVAMSLGAPLFAPGTGYRYSDAGYLLLGEIIERHTGLQLGAAFRSLLRLNALGLVATYQESVDAVPPLAGPRAKQDLLAGIDDSMIDASTDLWGAGGLVSDARDLALFMRALLEGRVLGRAALARMLAVASDFPDAPGRAAYARGIERFEVGSTVCFGHDAFSGAFAVHCPAAGITVAGSIHATTFVGAPEPLAVAMEFVRALQQVR